MRLLLLVPGAPPSWAEPKPKDWMPVLAYTPVPTPVSCQSWAPMPYCALPALPAPVQMRDTSRSSGT